VCQLRQIDLPKTPAVLQPVHAIALSDQVRLDPAPAQIRAYSLKQGIEDGFLAPYKVIRIELLTTGIDATTCKLIVIDKTINSMTTFKQSSKLVPNPRSTSRRLLES
jgi:hypothetical protein